MDARDRAVAVALAAGADDRPAHDLAQTGRRELDRDAPLGTGEVAARGATAIALSARPGAPPGPDAPRPPSGSADAPGDEGGTAQAAGQAAPLHDKLPGPSRSKRELDGPRDRGCSAKRLRELGAEPQGVASSPFGRASTEGAALATLASGLPSQSWARGGLSPVLEMASDKGPLSRIPA